MLHKGLKLKQNIIKHIKDAHTSHDSENARYVHITYGADNLFLYGTGVSITSLLLNNSHIQFHFHIFSNNISSDNYRLFEELSQKYHTKITFYILDDDILKSLPTASKSWNHSIYFRLIAIDYFSDKLDSIIYLDSDIICKKSLSPLLSESFDDAALIAVHDNFVDTSDIKKIIPELYFNSGFLYFNLSKLRHVSLTEKVISIVTGNKFSHPDQDALNIIFNDQVKIVDHRFNSFFNIDSIIKNKKKKFKITSETVFIHYVGVTKPWHDWAQNYNEVSYFNVARENSPWINIPLLCPSTYKQLSRKSVHLRKNGKFIYSAICYVKYLIKKYLSRIF